MKIFEIKDAISPNLLELTKSSFYKFLTTSKKADSSIVKQVEKIIATTKKDGDKALISYSNKFDKAQFSKAQNFIVNKKEIDAAIKNISPKTFASLQMAYARIFDYHKKQLPEDFLYKDTQGVTLGNSWRAIESIGVYAPGGTASYPSSVLMCAVPAIVAGSKNIKLCAPSESGKLSDAVLVAAHICGIKEIYKIGGAQAIAALAFGTKSIKKVDKIVGPGNSFVATAKKILYGKVGIDMIAGPTDITIICDSDNNPAWIAADALSQLEHGPDSKAFIITDDKKFAQKIIVEIDNFKSKLPRKNIIEKSLKNSAIFVIKNLAQSVHLSNFIAPEHLEIACKNSKDFFAQINNAGAVFLGKYSPESIGDYIAGPSHTLPTEGTARFASGLSVYDFLKRISLISCDKNSFAKIAESASILAECEGLMAHKLSIDIRK
ncbi:MAG: histidinol dehydrogenase [Rickettsiales bacterium]|nr:histidinol dehydrogenase [Rickettsiales bacterium]